jgi:hypothetical protein
MPTDIYTLGIEVDSTDVTQADAALDGLANAADHAGDEVQDLGSKAQGAGAKTKSYTNTTMRASKATRGLGANAGQAGIQVQQFVGQIQGGQNAMVALSQQSADLGFVLGAPLVGVIVSLGAVLAGVLMTALNSSKNALKDLTEELDVFGESFATVSQQIKVLAAEELTRNITEQEKVVSKINKTYQEQSDKLLDLRQMYKDRVVLVQGESQATTELALELSQVDAERQKEIQTLEKLQARLAGIRGENDVPDDAGAKAAAALAARHIANAELIQAQINLRRFSGQDEIEVLRAVADAETAILAIRAAEDFEAQQTKREARENSLQGEMDAVNAFYGAVEESRQRDNMLNAASLQTQLDQRRGIGAQTDKEEKEGRENTEKQKFLISKSFSSLFTTLMQSESKELFNIGKVGAAGKAVMDAYASINATLAQGGAFAIPAAVAVGAAAFANVASILSSSYGNTSSGGGSAPISAPAQTQQQAPQQQAVSINLQGSTFGSTGGQDVVEALQEFFDRDGEFVLS